MNDYEQEDGVEYVESIYQWKPSLQEDGSSLTCRATHSKFKDFLLERHIALDIYRQ